MSRLAFLFGVAMIALLVVSLYRSKSGAEDARAEIAQVEVRIEAAKARKALLEAEFSHMSRREWIEAYAREELGMGPAKAAQFAQEADLDAIFGPPADDQAGSEAGE